MTLGLALVSLLSLVLWFRPVAFPASLERTTPAATVRLPADGPLNFAEGLPLYFRDHDGPPMPVGGFELDGETVLFTGDVARHVGR